MTPCQKLYIYRYKKALRGGLRACNNLPQPPPDISIFGGCGRLLHALNPPRSAFLVRGVASIEAEEAVASSVFADL